MQDAILLYIDNGNGDILWIKKRWSQLVILRGWR